MSKKDSIEVEGTVKEALPNANFKIELANGHEVLAHVSGKIRMNFIRVIPGVPKSKVKSRIVISPIHAKTFMLALQDNIKKYEQKFGAIKVVKNELQNQIKISKDNLPN